MGCLKLSTFEYRGAQATPVFFLGEDQAKKEDRGKNRINLSAFGVTLEGRNFSSPKYRYGFQGQERDDEIKGDGNSWNYEYRMHDPRLGRFFAIDPLSKKYPHYTPYSFSGNKVIAHVELEGAEDLIFFLAKKGVFGESTQHVVNQVDVGVSNWTNKTVHGVLEVGKLATPLATDEDYGNFIQGVVAQTLYTNTSVAKGHLTKTLQSSSNSTLSGLGGVMAAMQEQDKKTNAALAKGDIATWTETVLDFGAALAPLAGEAKILAGLGGRLLPELSAPVYRLIKNKLPKSVDGKIMGQFRNGAWEMEGKTKLAGKFDYIIDANGNVKIGRKHSYMSNGNDVRAAGPIKFRRGKVVGFDNASGHYLPTPEEAGRFKQMFEDAGVDISKAVQKTYSANGRPVK